MAKGVSGLVLLLLVLAVLRAAWGRPECPRCRHAAAGQCRLNDVASAIDECVYLLDNATVRVDILFSDNKYFALKCERGVKIDDATLPEFDRARSVRNGTVRGCAVPQRGYADLFRRMRVTPTDKLMLMDFVEAKLTRAHFEGMPPLRELLVQRLAASGTADADDDFLEPFKESLRELNLVGVTLSKDALDALPEGLETLQLKNTQARCEDNCAAMLRRLRRLRALRWSDDALRRPPALHDAERLQSAFVAAPLTQPLLTAPHSLEVATFYKTESIALSGCGAVRQLTIMAATADELPKQWLRDCAQLRSVALRQLRRLSSAAEDALRGAAALQHFALAHSPALRQLPHNFFAQNDELDTIDLSHNGLVDLPHDLFSNLTRLQSLLLNHNQLTTLPPGVFTTLSQLQILDMTRNQLFQLASDVFIGNIHVSTLNLSWNSLNGSSLIALSALSKSLMTLYISHNPLGNLCPSFSNHTNTAIEAYATSALRKLDRLTTLDLTRTNATKICDDWRHDLRSLNLLVLNGNSVSELVRKDLTWTQNNLTVKLIGNDIKSISIHPQELNKLKQDSSHTPQQVKIIVDSQLSCDWRMYWFEQARRSSILPVEFPDLHCAPPGPTYIKDLNLNELEGPLTSNEGCPSQCGCGWRPATNTSVVRCTGRGLSSPPTLSGIVLRAKHLRLDLSRNRIKTFPGPEHLPYILDELDLRNNSIDGSHDEDGARAVALMARVRGLRLAGNPLRCDCADPMLFALRASQVQDFAALECRGGRSLAEEQARCAGKGARDGWAWVTAVGGALAVAALLLGAALHRTMRTRIKAILLQRGLCLRWLACEEDDYVYDAFLSYSHWDESFANEVIEQLESGPRPLRLCVHHRDWPIGGWIPAQIAESVSQSRRTVVLLSRHYLTSGWARTEFREAHASMLKAPSRRAIVVVLLEAEVPDGLDDELQRYVLHNTYLRRDDPLFWAKLRLAVPPAKSRCPRQSRASLRHKSRLAAVAVAATRRDKRATVALPAPGEFVSPA